jgi:Peptidase family M1 domain/Secretion system C-terminal sorting domain
MKPKFYAVAIVLFFSQFSFAQSDIENVAGCKRLSDDYKSAHQQYINTQMEVAANGQQSVLALPTTGTDYDVKYYRLELRINPDTSVGKYIKGKVTIYFTTKIANFSVANFDMATTLASDSVYYHGAKLAAGNINRLTANLIKITIPSIAAAGTLDSVSIFYKGVPPVTAGFSGGTGYVNTTHTDGVTTFNYTYTLSEPYSSYTWWPCKSFVVNDKADSMDMIVSTPLGFRSAGNGTRVYEVTQGSNVITYWKERYPVPAYLVCVAVANYVQYPTTPTMVNIGGTMMPYYNLIFPETDTAGSRLSLDRLPLMLTTYSTLFGDYPFKNEKYGNYTFGFGGGMEHTTFSGESNTGVYTAKQNWDVLAHELAHQWWGDNVTCGSWRDIWVNESFADYSEALLLEFAPSIGTTAGNTALSWRQMKKNNSTSGLYQAKTTYVTDTSDILTIFTPSVYIYDRGGMIISMLRKTLGDTKFFQALKNYQSDPLIAQGNGFTTDVKRHMEAASGLNLTTFFSQWMNNTGYAKYSGPAGSICEWNNSGTNIVLKLVQKPQSSALARFDMPVVVRIQGSTPATMDTTVVVYDQGGTLYYDRNGVLTASPTGTLINFPLSFTPVTITLDPFSEVMATGTFTKNTALAVTATVLATNIVNFTGNKETDNNKLLWSVDNAHDYAAFEIEKSTDGIAFEKIATVNAGDFPNKYDFSYNDYKISSGTVYYRIKIIQKDGAAVYTKTISIASKAANGTYTITPNPASDYILISGTGSREIADIKIYDATGRMVKELLKQSFLNNNAVKIAVADLGVGNYFVEIQSANNSRYTRQIVIVK